MKVFFIFLFCTGFLTLQGAVLPLDGNFEKCTKEGKLLHWVFHTWRGFKPDPVLQILPKADKGKNVLSIRKVTAQHGSVIRPHKRFPGRSGDKVQISFRARGTGKGSIGLYFYKKGGSSSWNQAGPTHSFALKKSWTDYTFTLPVTDGINGMTTEFDIVLGCGKGQEMDLSSLEAHHEEGLYRGDHKIPIRWTVFAPMNRKFKAPSGELNTIPSSLNGVKGRKAQLMANTLDLAPFLGGKGAYKCAWAFAELNTPIACDYTLGASADWWMEFYLNGKKIFDTMENGNEKPVKINSHIATVHLKKGKNILAVKVITGKASSDFVIGGPSDLRKIVQSIRFSKILWVENFDRSTVQCTPRPRLVKREITPGLLTLTGQAVYKTSSGKAPLTIRGKNARLHVPAHKETYGAMSIRIQQFGTPETGKGPGSLHLRLQEGKTFFTLKVTSAGSRDRLLRLQFSDPQGVLGNETIPERKLPADFTLAISGEGKYILSVHSLVDSSITTFQGNSASVKKMKSPRADLVLASGSVILDNFMTGTARDKGNHFQSAPCKLEVAKSFDPVKANWPLVFSDDFNGEKIDLSKWYFSYNSNRSFAEVKEGLLRIKCDWNPEKTRLQSAGLWTKKEFKYGYFEAKVRFRSQPGWWAAFWLCTPTPTNSFIDGMEIDIFEDYYLRPLTKGGPVRDILDHNLHMNVAGNTKSWNYNSHLPGKISDFYVIGCKWTPFEISYYLNGKLIASKSAHSPHDSVTFDAISHGVGNTPLKAIVSGQCGRSGGNAKDGIFPEYFLVDYVKIYAMPQKKDLPRVTLECDRKEFGAVMNDTLRFTAKITPGSTPVKTVYLFDSGFLLEHKTEEPWTFEIPVTREYYDISNYAAAGRSGKAIPFGPFLHAYSVFVQDEAGNTAYSPVIRKLFVAGQKSTPFRGKAHKIPGVIRLPFFDEGGENVAYFDRDISNRCSKTFRTGDNIDCNLNGIYFTLAGEWMNYTLDVAESGLYSAILTYGCPIQPNAGIELFIDDTPVGILDTKATKDWSIRYQTTLKGIPLKKGKHILKLMLRTNGVNMSTLRFVKEK